MSISLGCLRTRLLALAVRPKINIRVLTTTAHNCVWPETYYHYDTALNFKVNFQPLIQLNSRGLQNNSWKGHWVSLFFQGIRTSEDVRDSKKVGVWFYVLSQVYFETRAKPHKGIPCNDQFTIAHEIFYKRFHLKIIQLEILTPLQKHLRTYSCLSNKCEVTLILFWTFENWISPYLSSHTYFFQRN